MLSDARKIIDKALETAMPGNAVKEALEKIEFKPGKLIVVAAGKAAWEMAHAAAEELGDKISCGAVVTKYDHSKGDIKNLEIYEAGHPVPDENSFKATARTLELVNGLSEEDNVLFLLSGGGSALFESPVVSGEEMADITKQLLASGADIVEMNTIRKRLSNVKGGRFAQACKPAHVYTVVLSDIIGDPLDMIASGPAYPASSTCEEAAEIIERYKIKLSDNAKKLMKQETPKSLDNVDTYVTGSVKQLCKSAEETAKKLGYEPIFLTACLNCEAREAGRFLGTIAKDHCAKTDAGSTDTKALANAADSGANAKAGTSLAYICGGETVVHLTGKGKGGRNQELALAAAEEISGLEGVCIFSVGSDGTDGPTDAAGGIVDGTTKEKLLEQGINIKDVLAENDAYNALKKVDGLIVTGPTGTNVNDLAVVLIKK